KKDFPLIPVGEFELNRNPDNYFQDVEQAAFNPTNIVPGIGFSPDKMLQGRLFSYGDAQRYRLGVNHFQIPVNKPRCPYHAFHRDGAMRVDGNYGDTLHYNPNSYGEWQEQPHAKEPALELSGDAYAYNYRDDDEDYFTQPGDLFRIIKKDGKADLLFKNTAAQIGAAEKFIQIRHIRNCYKADPEYGEGVAKALGLTMDEVNKFDMSPYDKWAPKPTKSTIKKRPTQSLGRFCFTILRLIGFDFQTLSLPKIIHMATNLSPALERLLSPAKLNSLTLKNRIIKAATFESMLDNNSNISDSCIAFHEKIAAGGTGMTTLAYCSPEADGRMVSSYMYVREEVIPQFKKLAETVHKYDCKLSGQIAHCGAFSRNDKLQRKYPVGPTSQLSYIGAMQGIFYIQGMDQ